MTHVLEFASKLVIAQAGVVSFILHDDSIAPALTSIDVSCAMNRTVVFKALRDIAKNEELTWKRPESVSARFPAPMPGAQNRPAGSRAPNVVRSFPSCQQKIGAEADDEMESVSEGDTDTAPTDGRPDESAREDEDAQSQYRDWFDGHPLEVVVIRRVDDGGHGLIQCKEMCMCGSVVSPRQQVFCRRCGNCFHSFCVDGHGKHASSISSSTERSSRMIDCSACPVCRPTVSGTHSVGQRMGCLPGLAREAADEQAPEESVGFDTTDDEHDNTKCALPAFVEVQARFQEFCRYTIKNLVSACDDAGRDCCCSGRGRGSASGAEVVAASLEVVAANSGLPPVGRHRGEGGMQQFALAVGVEIRKSLPGDGGMPDEEVRREDMPHDGVDSVGQHGLNVHFSLNTPNRAGGLLRLSPLCAPLPHLPLLSSHAAPSELPPESIQSLHHSFRPLSLSSSFPDADDAACSLSSSPAPVGSCGCCCCLRRRNGRALSSSLPHSNSSAPLAAAAMSDCKNASRFSISSSMHVHTVETCPRNSRISSSSRARRATFFRRAFLSLAAPPARRVDRRCEARSLRRPKRDKPAPLGLAEGT